MLGGEQKVRRDKKNPAAIGKEGKGGLVSGGQWAIGQSESPSPNSSSISGIDDSPNAKEGSACKNLRQFELEEQRASRKRHSGVSDRSPTPVGPSARAQRLSVRSAATAHRC